MKMSAQTKRGRPLTTKKTLEGAVQYVEQRLAEGLSMRAILVEDDCPVARQTFYDGLHRHPEFSERIKKARRQSLEEHAQAIALGERRASKEMTTMTIFLLKGVAPEIYAKPDLTLSQTNVTQIQSPSRRKRNHDEDLAFAERLKKAGITLDVS